MALDIRIPMGLMFSLLGATLVIYGLASSGQGVYARSLGININLWWGLVILGFGLLMLLLAWWNREPNVDPHNRAASPEVDRPRGGSR